MFGAWDTIRTLSARAACCCAIVLAATATGTALADVSLTYTGPGVVRNPLGDVPAWRWNDTAREWRFVPLASGSNVYLWPWTQQWEWVWTSPTGWLAVSQTYAHTPQEPTRLLWSDEFLRGGGASVDSTAWEVEAGAYGYARDACFAGRNVYHDGQGHLVLAGRRESVCSGRAYTAGSVHGVKRFGPPEPGQTIVYEARIKAPCGSGQWPAFWSTGVGASWPVDGEIDMVEIYGNRPLEASQDLHASTTSGGHWHKPYKTPADVPWCRDFHRYGLRWSVGRLEFTVDGRVTVTRTRGDLQSGWLWPFDRYPQILRLDLALGGDLPGPIDDSKLPSAMLVDYVRVFG